MREEDSTWFPKWEDDDLPPPEELMPLSQTLITPDLALAFDIRTPHHPPPISTPSSQPNSGEFDSPSAAAASNPDEPARTLKRPRLVWTPQLHKRFVDAVSHLGIKNAVPKTIMQLMSVDGLTRENVASHLQKYRLYLKRMQGTGGAANAGSGGDPATDHLFASYPVPPHFLHQGRPNSAADHYLPYVPVPHQYHHRQLGHFGSPPNPQFEHPFLARPNQPPQTQPLHRVGTPVPASYVDDLESAANGRRVLTLFPTGDD